MQTCEVVILNGGGEEAHLPAFFYSVRPEISPSVLGDCPVLS